MANRPKLSAEEERIRLAKWLRHGELWLPSQKQEREQWLPDQATIDTPLSSRGALPVAPPVNSEGLGA